MKKILQTLTLLSLVGSFFGLNAFADSTSFIIKVKTDNSGDSHRTQFTIPIRAGYYTYDYDVFCDLNSSRTPTETGVTGNYTCNYTTAGTYTIEINGTFPQIYFNDTGDKEKILLVEQWGSQPWKSMYKSFWGTANLVINASDAPDLSGVSDISQSLRSNPKHTLG